MNTRKPAEVFPPGDYIREELEARGWTQANLAQIMGRPQPAINELINGKRGITADTAVALSAAFGTSPQFWLNLDSIFRLAHAEVDVAAIHKRARRLATGKPFRKAQMLAETR